MKRSFLYLVGLTLAAILVVLFLAPGDGSPGKSSRDTLLLPAIAEQVNDVNRVEIVTAGETVIATLVKTDGAWLVEHSRIDIAGTRKR